MSPRDRSPVRRQPSGKDHWNQWSPYNLTLLQLEQTSGSSGQNWSTAPPTEPGFSQGFFLRSVTDGVLVPCRCCLWLASWGHLISSEIIDLIAQILFKMSV